MPSKVDYSEYLKSPAWKTRRTERAEIDGWKCAICGSDENLNVHHLTYKNIGNENVQTDLVTLCRKCHASLHRIREHSKDEYDWVLRVQNDKDNLAPLRRKIRLGALQDKVHDLLVIELWARDKSNGGDLKLFDTGMKTAGRMCEIASMIYDCVKKIDISTTVKRDLRMIRTARIVETYIKTKSIKKTAETLAVSENSVHKTLKRHGFNATEKIN